MHWNHFIALMLWSVVKSMVITKITGDISEEIWEAKLSTLGVYVEKIKLVLERFSRVKLYLKCSFLVVNQGCKPVDQSIKIDIFHQ